MSSGPPAKRFKQTCINFGRGSCSEGIGGRRLAVSTSIGKRNIWLIIGLV